MEQKKKMRAHQTQLFRRKEQTVLFQQKVPKMPEGYYSGDKPNPNLRAFVESHIKDRHHKVESANYNIGPFSQALHISNRRSAINDLHIYWSKKPHEAVQAYINHYANPGSLVLDPFVGSGGTAICALRRGCSVIAIDLSPAATFITKYYCTPVHLDEFESAFKKVTEKVRPTIEWLYEARSPNGEKANVAYTVWSQVFRCEYCLSFVPLGHCVAVPAFNKDGTLRKTRSGEQATVFACPHCYNRGHQQIINTGSQRYGRVPIRSCVFTKVDKKNKRYLKLYPFSKTPINSQTSISLEYIAKGCTTGAEKFEIERLIEIRDTRIPFPYPNCRMMNLKSYDEFESGKWGVLWRAGVADFLTVDEVFEKRALWALAAYCNEIRNFNFPDDIRDALFGVLSSSLWNCSRMYRERKKGGGPQEGVYYLPPISREVNVANVISGKKNTFILANREIALSIKSKNLLISTQCATNLKSIPSDTIDYIFTDPPYSWKVPYGELNFLWESFLGFSTAWHGDEITISDVRGIDEMEWANRLQKAFYECYRVLKPGHCLTLCYHDSAEGTWERIQDIMAKCGFVVERSKAALSIDTGQKSLKQLTSGKITQRDLIINFRKPKRGDAISNIIISDSENVFSFKEKVGKVIHDHLNENPGATKDRIYDEVVSHMVRAGQMRAHNFDELLHQAAESVSAGHEPERWYLKDIYMGISDATESAKEDAAAEKIRIFIIKQFKKNPGQEGVHYSDLFEHYVYQVEDKPRRPLADWLLDYFYKTESGTYRLPISEEEEKLKAEGRKRGTQRLIKRYLTYLVQGVAVPDKERPNASTIAEWIRHCKRSGLYEQGKLLYEKGGLNLDNLSEEVMVNVEEDYQVCVRMLARSFGTGSKKRTKKGRQKK